MDKWPSGTLLPDTSSPNATIVGHYAFPLLIILMLAAFIFGGGGAQYGLANLAVQLTALGVLATQRNSFAQFWLESPLVLRILIAASLALPLLQLIPLPEAVWTGLPSRELVSRALDLIGGGGWRPFSLDPLRTLLALTALVTPLAVMFVGWNLPRDRLIDLGWVIVAFGIVTVLLGTLQLGSTSDTATFYGSRAPGKILLGTFANRNSTGLFLTLALALAALLPFPRRHPAVLPARLAVCALLLTAVALTQSRTSLVLALIPVILGVLRMLSDFRHRSGRPSGARSAMIGLGAIALLGTAVGAVLVSSPGRIGATLERFEARDDPRRFIWDDATYSVARYWPLGAGMGTFDEVYQVDESLENLTVRRAGRAHNDFIELAIEAGAPGLALAAAWLALIGWLSWLARKSSQRWVAWSGSAFLLAIALQSITDYPLRNQTILAFAAFALLLLTRIATDRVEAKR